MVARKIARATSRVIIKRPNLLWKYALVPLLQFGGFVDITADFSALYKIVKGLNPVHIKLSTSYCSIAVETEQNYYKIPFTSMAERKVIEEYNNWCRLNEDGEFREIIPQNIDMLSENGFVILKLIKYEPLDRTENAIEAAEYLLNAMRAKGEKRDAYATQSIQRGLDFLKNYCPAETYKFFDTRLNLFRELKVLVGFTHGDFHSRNILKKGADKFLTIDLDRFNRQGIQALDAVYFIVDTQSRLKKSSWHEQLRYYHKNNWNVEHKYKNIFNQYIDIDSKLLTYIFFLDRIGQEYSESSMKSKWWLNNTLELVEDITLEEALC